MIGSFRLPVSLTSSGDTTAPTILSATVEDANPDKLVVVFSEVVTITDITGLTITGDATPTLSAPTGSGSTTIIFTLSTAITNGQSVTLNVASSNTIEDTANNALVATTKAITNNVAAVGYDVDYQAVLDYATTNSIALPTTTQQDIDNQFIIDYKATGAWDKDDVVFKFKGTSTPEFKLICWKRLVRAEAFGSLTWSDSGVKGNGTNAYIKSGYIPSATNKWSLNDASIGFSSFALNTVGCIVGSVSLANGSDYAYVAPRSGTSILAINGSPVTTDIDYQLLGYQSLNRYISSSISIDDTNFSSLSESISTIEIFILARNFNTPDGSTFGNGGLEFISFGSSKDTINNDIKAIF